jgi:hypothetical protein
MLVMQSCDISHMPSAAYPTASARQLDRGNCSKIEGDSLRATPASQRAETSGYLGQSFSFT